MLALAGLWAAMRDWEDAWLHFAAAARVCPGWKQEQGGCLMEMGLVRATRFFLCSGFPPSCCHEGMACVGDRQRGESAGWSATGSQS